jgi:hypothetical protein
VARGKPQHINAYARLPFSKLNTPQRMRATRNVIAMKAIGVKVYLLSWLLTPAQAWNLRDHVDGGIGE